MTQLIGEIKRLERSWSEADAQIHNALRTIGASLHGPGLLGDIGFQIGQQVPNLQRRLDLIVSTQKIGLDKGVVWADETLWPSSSPASGAAAAKSVADQLRQARKDAASVGGQEALDHKTLALLERHQHDPYFAAAFAKEVPPKELKALLGDLYTSVRNSLDESRPGPPSSDLDRLAKALSVTLGTASRGVGGMKLPKGYADELIATDGAVAGLDNRIVDKLLRYGTFDDAFLRDIANKVFDNAQKPISERQDIIEFGPGLAAALANNARVAQDFFTDPARKPLAFLMRQTDWGREGGRELGRAIEAATMSFRDHGQPPGTSRGYKSALIASWAAHFWADPRAQNALPSTRQSAARVFAAYMSDVHRVANADAPESPGVTPLPDTDPNLPGKQPYGAMFDPDAVKNVMIWAFKDPLALKTVVEGHGEYSVKVMDAQGKQINDKINSELAEWRKDHPNATEAEQKAHRQKLLNDSMGKTPKTLFDAQVYTLGKSLHFIADAGNLTNIHEADRKDASRKAFKDGMSRTVKLALTPAGDVVVAGYEFLEENVSDHIKFTEGKAARSRGEETLRESQRLFKDLAANTMLRHGLFGDESTPGSAHPHALENYDKKSPGYFLADGRIIPRSKMDSTQAHAYSQWRKMPPASAFFRETDRSVWEAFQMPVPPYEEAEE
ncbi:hypothetical protein [Nonomuraea sp. NPDC049480]|uniref:hypothetical protein n=1 Tax=Nonomuraea sp. NPDC049480 TaxID=3364353 RepID=UPI0037AFB61B